MKRKLLVFQLIALWLSGQSGLPDEELYYRDGSNNVEYICKAAPTHSGLSTIFHVTAASSQAPLGGTAANLTSIADATNTATVTTSAAHGLRVGQRVIVAGATGDTDLNGTYTIATVPSTTTFTFTSANVTDTTYNEATLNVSTNYTRDSQLVWSIQKFFYTTTYLDRSTWARSAIAPTNARQFSCAGRATYF
jgi:hypothetical protein